MSWINVGIATLGLGLTIAGTRSSARALRDGARDAEGIASQNSADLLSLTGKNNVIRGDVASFNANSILAVGFANAAAIRENAERNAELFTIQFEEEIRRHIIGEKKLAGQIRAQFSSTGFSVNEGTPLRYLHNELDEAERSRDFLVKKGKLTVANFLLQEFSKAGIAELEAGLTAEAILFNHEAESSIYLNEAIAQSNAILRGGGVDASLLSSQADQLLIGGIVQGIGFIGQGVEAFVGRDRAATIGAGV